MSEFKPGWGKSPLSPKWHWFQQNGLSLCHRIGFYRGDTEEGNDNSADNCARCRKLLDKSLKSNAPREAGAVAPSLHADVRGEVSDG